MIPKTEEISYYYGYFSKNFSTQSKTSLNDKLVSFIKKHPFLKRAAAFYLNRPTLKKKEFDLYWQGNFIPHEIIQSKHTVTTVHDFSIFKYESYHPKDRVEYFKTYFYKNTSKSDVIITPSHYTKSEVEEYLNFKGDIEVINHGVDSSIFKLLTDNECAEFNDMVLPKNFILFVGSIEPRKNLINLLIAYNMLKSEIKDELNLLLVGFKGWDNSDITELIKKNSRHIKYLGFLSDKQLAFVYNKATMFVYPSLYEGFGIPPIEAMACGTPVISADNSSLPEACGKAALFINPSEPDDIKLKIEKVYQDTLLKNSLIEKGLKRAASLTWKKSAEKHWKIFENFIKI